MRCKNKKRIILPAIFSGVTFIGALGVSIAIMLSEISYSEIDEFLDCPTWYQIFMWISLVLALVGAAVCCFVKRPKTAKSLIFYKTERNIEFALTGIGFFMMIVSAMRRDSRVSDMVICLGGAVCCLGLFLVVGTAIGVSGGEKHLLYSEMTLRFARKNPCIKLNPPASAVDLLSFESELCCALPPALQAYYNELNGDSDMMFSVAETVQTTKLVRENFSPFNPLVANLVCFGGNGAGDYYCYLVENGKIKDDTIFTFYHETNEITITANTLVELISFYYNGYLY